MPLAVCSPGAEFQFTAPTVSSNRVCAAVHPPCTSSEFEAQSPSPTTNRVCTTASEDCPSATRYVLAEPTVTSNRVCAAVHLPCTSPPQFEAAAPTATTDRYCVAATTCRPGVQFQSVAPTWTSDRACSPFAVCDDPIQYESRPATPTSNRLCMPLLNCIMPISYQVVAPTPTTNRGCDPTRSCTADQFIVSLPTQTTNRVCAAICTCSPGQQQVRAPVPGRTDRICASVSNGTQAVIGGGGPKLSAGEDAGIVVGVLMLLAGGGVAFFYYRGVAQETVRMKNDLELNEMLLADERATHDRMRQGWRIGHTDITMSILLARGGFGEVWRGTWGHIPVAIKLLHGYIYEVDPMASEEFEREAVLMQSIAHPNLLVFHGAGTTAEGAPFLVVELMGLGALSEMIKTRDPRLTWPARRTFATDIARGMAHLHSLSIVHRDLKSANCLVDESLHAKVGDFGASRLIQAINNRHFPPSTGGPAAAATAADSALTTEVGTLSWMAPEVLDGATDYDRSVDVWSFGVVLYELAALLQPWAEIEATNSMSYKRELLLRIKAGQRPSLEGMSEPPPQWIVELMDASWDLDATRRPGFPEIQTRLSTQPEIL